jgi:hypothetical protein
MSERVEILVREITQRLLGTILVLAGCPAVEKAGEPGGGGGVPAAVQMRFDIYCAVPGCHIAGGQAPDLSASGSAQSITTTGTGGQYVVFGDTLGSYLAQRILPGSVGQMPPLTHPQLTPVDIQIILAWIAGAPFSESETDSATSGDMTTSDTMMADMGGGEPLLCSLEVIDPSVDVADAVDAGDGAMQIPAVVGEVLVRNCGCHYTDTIPMDYGVPYTLDQGLSTLADFKGEWLGLTPGGFEGMPAYVAIAARIDFALPMPPELCSPDGEPSEEQSAMTQEDYDLLMHWLGMEAPDGATYEPP